MKVCEVPLSTGHRSSKTARDEGFFPREPDQARDVVGAGVCMFAQELSASLYGQKFFEIKLALSKNLSRGNYLQAEQCFFSCIAGRVRDMVGQLLEFRVGKKTN